MDHTSLPWTEDRHIYWLNQPGEQEHHGGWTITDNHDGEIIATVNEGLPNFRANAAYIVKACNAYPKLIDALDNIFTQGLPFNSGWMMVPQVEWAAIFASIKDELKPPAPTSDDRSVGRTDSEIA